MSKKQSKNKARQNNQRKSKGRKMSSRRGNSKKKNQSKLSYRKRGGSSEVDPAEKTLLKWNVIFTGNNGELEGEEKKEWIDKKIAKTKLWWGADKHLDILLNYLKTNKSDVSQLEIIKNMDSIKYFIERFKERYSDYLNQKEQKHIKLLELINDIERQVILHEARALEAEAIATSGDGYRYNGSYGNLYPYL